MDEAKVDQALMLLISIKSPKVSIKEAVEVIELITNVPELVRETLRKAEAKGLITRKKGEVVIKFIPPLEDLNWPKPKLKKKICTDNCKRCGKRINNCHYVELEDNIIGPFGSQCLKKLKILIE